MVNDPPRSSLQLPEVRSFTDCPSDQVNLEHCFYRNGDYAASFHVRIALSWTVYYFLLCQPILESPRGLRWVCRYAFSEHDCLVVESALSGYFHRVVHDAVAIRSHWSLERKRFWPTRRQGPNIGERSSSTYGSVTSTGKSWKYISTPVSTFVPVFQIMSGIIAPSGFIANASGITHG